MTETAALSCADLLAAVSAPEGQGAELKDPATGEVVGYAPQSTPADLDEAVADRKSVRSYKLSLVATAPPPAFCHRSMSFSLMRCA